MGATTDAPTVAPATVGDLLAALAATLARSKRIARPEQEARDLLGALLGVPRSWLSLNGGAPAAAEWRPRAMAAAAKRARGEPLAYCVGTAAFRHMTLTVDERVLIPRPETEQLVDVAMAAVGATAGGVAVDIGTGSGAIALALASEGRFDRVVATDVSLDALTVARRNVELLRGALRAPVELRHGSLLAPLVDERVRLIVSNPPYIAAREAAALPSSVRNWEPPIALFGGRDGLTPTVQVVRQAAGRLLPGGVLALEADARRAAAVAERARADTRFTDVRLIKDLAGRERFVVARRKEDG